MSGHCASTKSYTCVTLWGIENTLFGTLNNARYTWYIVFGGKRRHGRSPRDGVLPAVCTEADLKTKPTESFTRQIKKYPLATAAIWLSLERPQHSTEPCHSNSKTRFLPPILCLSSASWCEWVGVPCSCPYMCFFALKRPCNGPLTLFNLGAILGLLLARPPPFYTRMRQDGFRFSNVGVLCVHLFERCTFNCIFGKSWCSNAAYISQ